MILRSNIFSFIVASSFCMLIAVPLISGITMQKKIEKSNERFLTLEMKVDTLISYKLSLYQKLILARTSLNNSLYKRSANIDDSVRTLCQQYPMSCAALARFGDSHEAYINTIDTSCNNFIQSILSDALLVTYMNFQPDTILLVKLKLIEFESRRTLFLAEQNRVDSVTQYLTDELESLNKLRIRLKEKRQL